MSEKSSENLLAMATALTSPNEEVRYGALLEISHDLSSEATRLLRQALGDEAWRVRKAAVSALIERLDDDSAWDVV
jgi:HEAT repeat protein